MNKESNETAGTECLKVSVGKMLISKIQGIENSKDGRISWDELFMWITRLYGFRSACRHFKVSAVFVRGDRILSIGYNGPSRGEPHCIEVGCAKLDKNGKRLPAGSGLCRGAHAELNAVANAAAEGVNLAGTKVYCTYSPCYDCAKVLVNLGIVEYVYEKDYNDEDLKGTRLLSSHGVIIRKLRFTPYVLNKLLLMRIEEEAEERKAEPTVQKFEGEKRKGVR